MAPDFQSGITRVGIPPIAHMRGSLMVRCQAHNLETVIACEGSNPSPATKRTELEFSSMSDICFMNIGVVALESRKNAGLI